jgi:hypothetical protein
MALANSHTDHERYQKTPDCFMTDYAKACFTSLLRAHASLVNISMQVVPWDIMADLAGICSCPQYASTLHDLRELSVHAYEPAKIERWLDSRRIWRKSTSDCECGNSNRLRCLWHSRNYVSHSSHLLGLRFLAELNALVIDRQNMPANSHCMLLRTPRRW